MKPEQILNAGVKLWVDGGFQKVKLRQIADVLEVSHPSILHHFRTVAILHDAIVRHAVSVGDEKAIQYLNLIGYSQK